MKRVYLLFIAVIFSCQIEDSSSYINREISLEGSRSIITDLVNPSVDYLLEKDGEEYLNKTDVALINKDSVYTLSFDLLTGANYKFKSFTIKDNSKIQYVLDENSVENINGFSIPVTATISESIKIYLIKVQDVVYEPLEYTNIEVNVLTDQSGKLEPRENTFKVSSNLQNATFKVYMYSIYWKLGAELNEGDVFDMDLGAKFDPLKEGDGVPWGKGSFKIETTNSKGEVVSVVGLAADWSKKNIHLKLEPNI